MQAKFQGVLLNVEKYEDLPGYKLFKGKEYIGNIYLDTNVFMISTDPFDKEKSVLSFPIEPKDFQLLDYNIVTPEWLCEQMEASEMSVDDVATYAGTSTHTVYRWRSGTIPNQSKAILFSLFNK